MKCCPPTEMLPSCWNVAIPLKCCSPAVILPSCWNVALLLQCCHPAWMLLSCWNIAIPLKFCPNAKILPSCWNVALLRICEEEEKESLLKQEPQKLVCCWSSGQVKKRNTQMFTNFKGLTVLNLTHSSRILCYFSKVGVSEGSVWTLVPSKNCSFLQIQRGHITYQSVLACAALLGILHMCSIAGPTCCSHVQVCK